MATTTPTVDPLVAAAVKRRIDGAVEAMRWLATHAAETAALVEAVVATVRGGGLLATCGNGGSAAEALHLAEELVGRYRASRAPLRAICLNADPTALTCIANDFGFDQIFARQVSALLGPGDALLLFSTSGRSPNLIAAADAARARDARVFGLLGRGGGDCLPRCDASLVVGLDDGGHVQEIHQVVLHAICECLE